MANALQVFRLPKLSRLRNDLALFIGSFELNLVESSLRHGVLRSVCGSLLPRRVRVSRGRAFVAIALGLGGLFTAAQVTAQTAVLTRSHDNARTGANMSETVLTPAAVAAKGLSRVRGFVVDDDPRIEAQPLYLPHLTMPDGKAHDVLFVASMGNHIWAFDVDGNGTWKTPQLGAPFVPPEVPNQGHRSTTIDSWGINIAWGILSTPVIDLDANRIYCVNWMLQNGTPALFAHRIDIATMTEIGTPKPIEASLGADVDAHGKPVKLQPDQKQRAALLLVPLRGEHKTLFVATTGGEDPGSPRGWMVAFDVDTFKQTAAWVSTPSSFGGGMWQGSQGPAADESGHVYAITGNGGYIRQHPNGVHDFNAPPISPKRSCASNMRRL